MTTGTSAVVGSSAGEVCTYLDWDSDFFGLRIARLNRSRLDEATVAGALDWCAAQRIDCLYFLADSDHALTPVLAERNAFRLTDVRVTFERTLAPDEQWKQDTIVRPAREEDLPGLRQIASSTHRDTRFYFDEHFDRAKCDQLYATWIENSFRGFAQGVLVAEARNSPVAYLTCHLKGDEAQIGLIGVSAQHQGQGLGKKLIQSFFACSRQHNAKRVTVVTQGRNLGAQRLYERNGFVTASLQLWYHRWFSR
ncbi:MAG TPA: GNAT family N-acetyltransferase [Terriglobales bacterium]|nr:GNAT family N-acetyltransferase [Terriglobales bacterium]